MENEALARLMINKQLGESGWRLLDDGKRSANVHVEYKTSGAKNSPKNGFADYILFNSEGFPLAVIEAKAPHKHPLVGKEQARDYAESQNIRFIYLSNGKVLFFWDIHGSNPLVVEDFHSPEALEAMASADPGAARGKYALIDPIRARELLSKESIEPDYIARSQMADYDRRASWKKEDERERFIQSNKLCFLRPYQLRAIQAVQSATAAGKSRFLLEMATGTGKTKTCAAIMKLFLRAGAAKRILFLVDRLELEEQARKAFVETLRKDAITVIYKENRSDWRKAEIVVSTVQSFLANDRYREEFSPADFGLVISDEAHRSISGEARSVFEDFRAYKLGLTATPRDLLRGIWAQEGPLPTECELEKRAFLDTYHVFGCDSGDPTFRYGLLEGVREGYLVNPTVLDCRTEKTTKLLSEEGLSFSFTDEEGDEREESFRKRDFEKRYFSEETNSAFIKTFLDNALMDPVSGELGKSLVFCVSQDHAAKVANLLNEGATRRWPGRYKSDFALQVTSFVKGAQAMTVAFSENTLYGKTSVLPDYDSCRVRACVTVAMMTTGYDCEDVLNVVLMRPVFSPTEFIQMKGRGTRKHEFRWADPKMKIQRHEAKKTFRFFDFFANYEFFEKDYDYEAIIKLPVGGGIPGEGDPIEKTRFKVEDESPDGLKAATWIEIGLDGMKIDRMFWQGFESAVKDDADIRAAAEKDDWESVLRYIRERILTRKAVDPRMEMAAEPPSSSMDSSLELIKSLVANSDGAGLAALFTRLFGRSISLPTRDQLLDTEFEKFVKRHAPAPAAIDDLRFFFISYVGEKRIREIIDSGHLAELHNTSLPTDVLRRLESWKDIVKEIKAEVPLEKFGA